MNYRIKKQEELEMIVVLKHGVTEQQMRNLIAWFKDQGVDVHVSQRYLPDSARVGGRYQ